LHEPFQVHYEAFMLTVADFLLLIVCLYFKDEMESNKETGTSERPVLFSLMKG